MKSAYETYKKTYSWKKNNFNRHKKCTSFSWRNEVLYCDDHNEFANSNAEMTRELYVLGGRHVHQPELMETSSGIDDVFCSICNKYLGENY